MGVFLSEGKSLVEGSEVDEGRTCQQCYTFAVVGHDILGEEGSFCLAEAYFILYTLLLWNFVFLLKHHRRIILSTYTSKGG